MPKVQEVLLKAVDRYALLHLLQYNVFSNLINELLTVFPCLIYLCLSLSRSELGKSLNTDEAAALGAVYQGAGRTKLFRVKKFIVKEGVVYPIQVHVCT